MCCGEYWNSLYTRLERIAVVSLRKRKRYLESFLTKKPLKPLAHEKINICNAFSQHKFTFAGNVPCQSSIRVNHNIKALLSFRYGREDEEVMGLKFCNEAIIALQQIWPKIETEQRFDLSPLQVN